MPVRFASLRLCVRTILPLEALFVKSIVDQSAGDLLVPGRLNVEVAIDLECLDLFRVVERL